MEPEGSLPQLQVPTTYPYPEPAQSISLHAFNSGAKVLIDCMWCTGAWMILQAMYRQQRAVWWRCSRLNFCLFVSHCHLNYSVSLSEYWQRRYCMLQVLPILISSLRVLPTPGTLGYNLRVSLMTLSRYFISLRSLIVTERSDPWKMLSCSWYAFS